MSKAKHTDGPWEHVKSDYLSHDAPGYSQMLSAGGILGGSSDSEEGPVWVIEGEINYEPDACLIAAAPELLAALKALADHVDGIEAQNQDYHQFGEGTPCRSAPLNNAIAIIAKAEGQS